MRTISEPIDTSITRDFADIPSSKQPARHETDPTLAAALFAAWSGDPAVVVTPFTRLATAERAEVEAEGAALAGFLAADAPGRAVRLLPPEDGR